MYQAHQKVHRIVPQIPVYLPQLTTIMLEIELKYLRLFSPDFFLIVTLAFPKGSHLQAVLVERDVGRKLKDQVLICLGAVGFYKIK